MPTGKLGSIVNNRVGYRIEVEYALDTRNLETGADGKPITLYKVYPKTEGLNKRQLEYVKQVKGEYASPHKVLNKIKELEE